MKFTISGKIDRRTCSIDWEDGKVTGDERAIGRVKDELHVVPGDHLNVGGITVKAAIEDPLAFLWAGQRVFGSEAVIDGEIPEAPDVPDGAVA